MTSNKRFAETAATDRLDQIRVVNKIFEECASLTSDNFWKDKFTQASRGKFPKGFTYKDGVLSHRKKGKPKPITRLIPHDPHSARDEFISFMQSTGKYSDSDMVHNERARIVQIQTSQVEIRSWSAVPPKSRKDYVERFVSFATDMYHLTSQQVKSLKTTIQMGLILGAFNKDNIIVIGNRIDSIQGISMDSSGLFVIDQSVLDNTYRLIAKATNKPETITMNSIYQPDTLDAGKIIEAMVRDFDRAKDNIIKITGSSLVSGIPSSHDSHRSVSSPFPQPAVIHQPQHRVLLVMED
jgi:hypothetical protein